MHVVAPLGATPADLARLGEADFNVVLYPEIAAPGGAVAGADVRPAVAKTVPIGVGATRDFIAEVAALAGIDADGRAGGRVVAAALVLALGRFDLSHRQARLHLRRRHARHRRRADRQRRSSASRVVGLGTYSREFAREVREAAKLYGVEPLITDDYLEVEAKVAELQPELVLGTQMERHIAKRLGIPCAVISAPVHVQDFPARYSPQMGFEGANVIFDTWVHPLMMGLEEHLLGMFREDFEFHDDAAPSHLGAAASAGAGAAAGPDRAADCAASDGRRTPRRSCSKIPFFVRGKARRNTERFAAERGVATDHRRDPVRCQSAFQPLTRRPMRVVDRDDGQPSGRRDRTRAHARCGASFRASSSPCTRPTNGAATPRRSSAAAPTSRAATSSSRRCCSWRITSAPSCRRSRRGATTATRWSCCMSAGEVVRLTRLGRFDMSERGAGRHGAG